ncbi:MAG: M3 family oligoendopeptidase [Spirochaetaceae bacterium]|jgi:pepF/M3 family oligoendopeptidase|nr:M3 family oligoendopeptidase [Spirochaetaceae bacterium]
MKHETAPRWNLQTIYPSFDSAEYRGDQELLGDRLRALLEALEEPLGDAVSAEQVLALIRAFDEAGNLAENLQAYAEAVYTTDTRSGRALAEINALEALALPLGKAAALFRCRLAEQEARILQLAEADEALKPYGFFLRQALAQAAFQMPAEMEDLAQDLGRSGGDAWGRLQEAISSTASMVWDEASGERKTVTALRDLAHRAERALRERAYRAELDLWKAAEIPLAAALNGVKGTTLTLEKRRGWKSILRKSAFQSRLEEGTLEALIAALEESLPLFRRYLKAKATLLGLGKLAFYDLFAPAPEGGGRRWSWEEAVEFVARRFDGFDPGMGAFARHAAAFAWIDAEGREGKVGGAYCTDFPLAGESRILCNFEGSFDSVTTVAHELGHGWHHEVIKDLPRSLSGYPMTLAETASIFAETIVFEGALADAAPAERLGLIEGNLKDSCQVVVDILSRFYFERSLFERRDRGELAAEELCALMIDAQKRTYGDALDAEQLHPYMWAVKSHYYDPSLAFYNYPYALGLLFSLALFARAREEGPSFAAAYRELLRLTGRASVEEAARAARFDLGTGALWRQGISLIGERVEQFENLAGLSALVGLKP